ncbi:MAG: hypothetical protein PUE01_12590 [Clostridiaceae bacterium]|nr:hypothetical protein [Clostridiaceae bacterium]
MYSNIYYVTDIANSELRFLEKVLKRKQPKYSIQTLQARLMEKEIPLTANSQTIGSTYLAAKESLKVGDYKVAKECYYMVYDLTNDYTVKKIIDGI